MLMRYFVSKLKPSEGRIQNSIFANDENGDYENEKDRVKYWFCNWIDCNWTTEAWWLSSEAVDNAVTTITLISVTKIRAQFASFTKAFLPVEVTNDLKGWSEAFVIWSNSESRVQSCLSEWGESFVKRIQKSAKCFGPAGGTFKTFHHITKKIALMGSSFGGMVDVTLVSV